MSVDTAELRTLIGRMEQLLAGPSVQAATQSNGFPAAVVAGELIESAWGNATVTALNLLSHPLYAEIGANSGAAAASPVVIPGLSLSLVVPAGASRIVEFDAFACILKPGAGNGNVTMTINLDGAQITGSLQWHTVNGYSMHRIGTTRTVAPGTHPVQIYLSATVDTANIVATSSLTAWVRATMLG